MNEKEPLFLKSQFMQAVRYQNNVIIWHSLFGNLKIVSNKIFMFLNEFYLPRFLKEVLNCETYNDITTFAQELINSYYLIPCGFNERIFLAKKMEV